MANGGRAGAGRAGVLAAAVLAVLVLAGCGLGRVSGVQPGGEQLRRALQAWSGFPVGVPPRPLVLAGPDVVDPPAGFPGGAAKLAYLERAVGFPARFPRGPAAAGGFRLITAGGPRPPSGPVPLPARRPAPGCR